MSSGPAKYELFEDLKKPKPSCKISKTPSPKISSPFLACDFNIEKITSCFLALAIFSIRISAAIAIKSDGLFFFNSVKFILFLSWILLKIILYNCYLRYLSFNYA